MKRFIICSLLIGNILSGCSLLPTQNTDERITALSSQSNWEIQGKISFQNTKNSVTGLLNWKQRSDQFEIVITGPLGQGTTILKGNRSYAELLLPGERQPRISNSVQTLMQETVGWSFPVEDLAYWAKGIPSPAKVQTLKTDKLGLISSMTQHGWQIHFKRYSRPQGLQWLPGLIKLKGYDQNVTLAINQWSIYN